MYVCMYVYVHKNVAFPYILVLKELTNDPKTKEKQ